MATCNRCGRKLKSEESIKLGFGRVCYKKVFGSSPKSRKNVKSSKHPYIKQNSPKYLAEAQITIEEIINDTKMEKEHTDNDVLHNNHIVSQRR